MSIFLQSTFPNTCCAFDPPGETLSPGLREQSAHYVTTTVFGNDIFPRVSSYTFSLLQDNIITSLCYCKISKLRFVVSFLMDNLNVENLFYSSISDMKEEKENIMIHWLRSVWSCRRCEP